VQGISLLISAEKPQVKKMKNAIKNQKRMQEDANGVSVGAAIIITILLLLGAYYALTVLKSASNDFFGLNGDQNATDHSSDNSTQTGFNSTSNNTQNQIENTPTCDNPKPNPKPIKSFDEVYFATKMLCLNASDFPLYNSNMNCTYSKNSTYEWRVQYYGGKNVTAWGTSSALTLGKSFFYKVKWSGAQPVTVKLVENTSMSARTGLIQYLSFFIDGVEINMYSEGRQVYNGSIYIDLAANSSATIEVEWELLPTNGDPVVVAMDEYLLIPNQAR